MCTFTSRSLYLFACHTSSLFWRITCRMTSYYTLLVLHKPQLVYSISNKQVYVQYSTVQRNTASGWFQPEAGRVFRCIVWCKGTRSSRAFDIKKGNSSLTPDSRGNSHLLLMRWGGNDGGKYGNKVAQNRLLLIKQPAFAGPRWETRTPGIMLPNHPRYQLR